MSLVTFAETDGGSTGSENDDVAVGETTGTGEPTGVGEPPGVGGIDDVGAEEVGVDAGVDDGVPGNGESVFSGVGVIDSAGNVVVGIGVELPS